MRIVFILLLFLSSVYSIEVDIDLLKNEIKNNPDNITTRIILARSYISQDNFDEAQKLLKEVLSINKKESKARFLLKDVKKLKQIKSLIGAKTVHNSPKLTPYFHKLKKMGKYEYATLMYEVLKRNNITLSTPATVDVIDSYIHVKSYEKALNMIKSHTIPPQEEHFLSAKIHQQKGENEKSEQEYQEALKINDREDIVLGLYDLYIKEGKSQKAKELLESYKRKDPKGQIYLALKKRDRELSSKRALKLKKVYDQDNSFAALKSYYYELEAIGEKKKAAKELDLYVKKHPKDEEAVLFYAQNLYWDHKVNKSLSILEPVVKTTKNRDILKLYADILISQKKETKAIPYLKRVVKLGGDKKTEKFISEVESNRILKKAVSAHKNKDYKQALRYYDDYFSRTKDPKIAKEIAELYFADKKAEESIPFYKVYLSKYPTDSKIRFRYASALDSLKRYKEAEPEYKRVASEDRDLYELASYRYAVSLISQKDDAKWNQSRSILQNLLKNLQKQKTTKKRTDLIKFTKATLKKVSTPMPKPKRYKDIMLTESQRKLIHNQELFIGSKLETKNISSVKSMLMPINTTPKKREKKDITLSFHSLDDDTINNISYGIRVSNIAKIDKGTLSVEAKRSRFKTAEKKDDATGFLAHFDFRKFSIGVGLTHFKEFNELIVEASYHKVLTGHDMTFGLKSSNGVFVNGNACMIENRLNVLQFSLYDAILLSDLDQMELGLTLNRYEDKNINLNSWLEYPIYKISYESFENVFSFSGSYEFNRKTDTCYYSAKFFDGNYIQIKPKIKFGKQNYIQGIGGIGYSFENSDFLYNYGLSAVISAYELFDIRIDCRHYQSGYSPDGANECYATAAYIW